MERILIDTNVLVNFLLKTNLSENAKSVMKTALLNYLPVIFTNVLEETVFILVREELKSIGVSGFHEQKRFVEKHGYEDLKAHRKFLDFINKAGVLILENRFALDMFLDILERYRLLPNDALIAATCKHYGIKKIATFDEDFRRVEFLEVVEP